MVSVSSSSPAGFREHGPWRRWRRAGGPAKRPPPDFKLSEVGMSGISRRGLLGWIGGLVAAAPALPAILEEAAKVAPAIGSGVGTSAGEIASINIVSAGAGYTSAPGLIVSGSMGAQLAEITRKAFVPVLYRNAIQGGRALAMLDKNRDGA
jgi:hypothetical protein